jgi:uncharacterized SAM-binding protein YcdF (DUF218 family)
MYFALSKILLFLISPFFWILALLLLGLVIKKPVLKRRLFISAAAVFLLFSMPVFSHFVARLWSYPAGNINTRPTYSCVIVLGGFAGPGGPEHGHFGPNCDRFIQGLKLKAMGKASHILVTSGNSSLTDPVHGFNEGNWTKTQLELFNVPDSAVLIENRSRNTIENAAFTKAMLESRHLPPPYILVTSDFHMRRSMAIFKKAGLNVIPYPCNYIAGGKFYWGSLIPNANNLPLWEIYIKEFIGSIVLWFKK